MSAEQYICVVKLLVQHNFVTKFATKKIRAPEV